MNTLAQFFYLLTEENEMEKKAWETGYIVLVIFSVIPWIILIVYLITLKYSISYYVDDQLVYKAKYKKNHQIEYYIYNGNNVWYKDAECTEPFMEVLMPPKNIKLYQNTVSEDANSEELQK